MGLQSLQSPDPLLEAHWTWFADRPDAGLDKFLSDHVLALHGGEGSTEYDEWQQDLPLEQRYQKYFDNDDNMRLQI